MPKICWSVDIALINLNATIGCLQFQTSKPLVRCYSHLLSDLTCINITITRSDQGSLHWPLPGAMLDLNSWTFDGSPRLLASSKAQRWFSKISNLALLLCVYLVSWVDSTLISDLQVGIAAQLPSGNSSDENLDYRSFWEFLLQKQDAYGSVPAERLQGLTWVCSCLFYMSLKNLPKPGVLSRGFFLEKYDPVWQHRVRCKQ